ncbi:helix-turn-helix transcriptional regulator [Actinoallomurus purpureus]|uniref:helix-turn-helix domain-containing protein n=1 Tax=Actinoallomurus purpureus TaxID=478114 RepID=UPI002093D0B3|nr:helix-turn-helix transcriptional regulator [Actinoallomurus purpureus]MCO6011057.1 helix-turn-helix transcriptional regulator [Actinoallomurus purpureus]
MAAQRDPHEAPAIRAFGIALETRRSTAELSKNELAEKLGCSPQYVGQIEVAKNMPSKAFAQDLDTFFVAGEQFYKLWKLVNDTRHLTTIMPGFEKYVELEKQASKIQKFEPLLITGLFQTEAYSRAVMGYTLSPDLADSAIAARMKRKELLFQANPPHVFFILDEGVIRRTVGSCEIMREQLAHLLELSDADSKVKIQVVPDGVGYYAGLAGGFTILGFDDKPDVVYTESSGEGKLVEGHDRVALKVVTWDLIQGHTLDVVRSRALIKEVMESYERV